MLAVLTSVGCSQRGEPFLQKLSRNNFNRRQLTLVGSGFVYSFILFAPKKAAKNMEMKNLNICWRTCCCCKLLQRGSRLHSRGWKQRWPKVWQSNSKKGVPIFQKIHLSVVATSTGRPRYSETRSTMSLSVRAVNTENIRNHIDLDRVLKHL